MGHYLSEISNDNDKSLYAYMYEQYIEPSEDRQKWFYIMVEDNQHLYLDQLIDLIRDQIDNAPDKNNFWLERQIKEWVSKMCHEGILQFNNHWQLVVR